MKNKGFISLTACMLAFLMLSFPVIALGMDESASSAFVPDTSGGYYEEFTDPTPSDDDVIGGVIGAMAGMLIFRIVLQLCFDFQIRYWLVPVYGLLGSLAGVFGDLCFSVIKRQTGIKDYGNLIPGHGGILDRFDSTMVVGPLAEILLILLPVAVR